MRHPVFLRPMADPKVRWSTYVQKVQNAKAELPLSALAIDILGVADSAHVK